MRNFRSLAEKSSRSEIAGLDDVIIAANSRNVPHWDMQRGGGLTRRPSAHSIPAGATNAGTELEGKKRAARHPLLR
jgi:hypothetical protein